MKTKTERFEILWAPKLTAEIPAWLKRPKFKRPPPGWWWRWLGAFRKVELVIQVEPGRPPEPIERVKPDLIKFHF